MEAAIPRRQVWTRARWGYQNSKPAGQHILIIGKGQVTIPAEIRKRWDSSEY
jgi:hypothetical protein